MSKVLLLLTDNELLEAIRAVFADSVHEVRFCAEPRRAVADTLEFQPDIVLSDIDNGDICGLELARLFKSYTSLSPIPFLLLTRRMPAVHDLEMAGFRLAADDLIELPAAPAEILARVGLWLNRDRTPPTLTERMAGPLADPGDSGALTPWFKGRITLPMLARLFIHLIRQNESGTLRLKGDRRQLKVDINAGHIVEVETNYRRDTAFGRYLMQIERITADQNERITQLAEKKRISQDQALVDLKILTAAELEDLVRRQKIEKVTQLFAPVWDGGAFHFVGERLRIPPGAMDPYPLAEILRQGILLDAAPEALDQSFDRARRNDVPFRVTPDLSEIVRILRLDPLDAERVAGLADLTLDRIRRLPAPEREPLLRVAFLALMAGAVRYDDDLSSPPGLNAPAAAPATHDRRGQYPNWDLEAYTTALSQGRGLTRKSDFRGAMVFLRRALEINPHSSEALALHAWCEYELSGKQSISVTYAVKEALKKAIGLDDANDMAYLLLGRIFKSEGKDGLANTYFRKAHEINPTNEEARKEVKLLQIVKKRRGRGRADEG